MENFWHESTSTLNKILSLCRCKFDSLLWGKCEKWQTSCWSLVSDSDGRQYVQMCKNALREYVRKSRSTRSQCIDELWVVAAPVCWAHLFIYLFNKLYYIECLEFTGSGMRLRCVLGGNDWMPWVVWPKCVIQYILMALSILNFIVWGLFRCF